METNNQTQHHSSPKTNGSNGKPTNNTQPSPDCWTTITKTKKQRKSKQPTQCLPSGNVLANNRYFLPIGLEKELHKHGHIPKQNQPNKTNASGVQITAIESKTQSNRCHKRNQRRARKRAEKRAAQAQQAKSQQRASSPSSQIIARPGLASQCPLDDSNSDASSVCIMQHPEEKEKQSMFGLLPVELITTGILSFLEPNDIASFGSCNRCCNQISEDGFMWKSIFHSRFPTSRLCPLSMSEWKLAYKLKLTQMADHLRCTCTKKTFLEEALGCGVDYTVNPKTKNVDYISVSQDLMGETSFRQQTIRNDVFGNKFKLFLPLYFSEEHFQRSLPQICKTVVRLCPEKKSQNFDPEMVLRVFPKIVNTFVVLLSDEGVAASRKSFSGLIRIHRLFLALAHEYPIIKTLALRRLKAFRDKEQNRTKSSCPNLGNLLSLLMIVDQKDCTWTNICSAYMSESFDRSVLWICKKFPHLERTHTTSGEVESIQCAEKRVSLTLETMTVNLRLNMFHVFFLHWCCKGTTIHRAKNYDMFLGQPEPDIVTEECGNIKVKDTSAVSSDPQLCFEYFRSQVVHILTVSTWQQFFKFVRVRCPATKAEMAHRLREHVKSSRRKGYHRAGMDFSRVHASGTSTILSKGQEYSASSTLRRVTFTDVWGFRGGTVYLDATCLMYRGKTLAETIDFRNRRSVCGAVLHSGDVMRADGGTHTVNIDLHALDRSITSCVFVISAYAGATLSDIMSPSISFIDADAEPGSDPLCTYDLDAHDKISHLTSVVMCKLYRARNGGWHVLAIGDAHRGAADDYGPIYSAVQKLV